MGIWQLMWKGAPRRPRAAAQGFMGPQDTACWWWKRCRVIPSAGRIGSPRQSETLDLVEFLRVEVLVVLSVEHAYKLWSQWAEGSDEQIV